jgi:hypothetical protein
MKYMDIEKFIDDGLLQEVNRQFFHPRGMALVVSADTDDETGEQTSGWEIKGIWDATDDPEGINFSDGMLSSEKATRVQQLWDEREEPRKAALGYVVQPIEDG